MSTSSKTKGSQRPRWRLWFQVLVVLLLLYVVSYFVLMDRHRPTSPYPRDNYYFESSFRWADKQRSTKDNTGSATPFPQVTIWNVVYSPLDKAFFHVFPRSMAEREQLRAIGYYR